MKNAIYYSILLLFITSVIATRWISKSTKINQNNFEQSNSTETQPYPNIETSETWYGPQKKADKYRVFSYREDSHFPCSPHQHHRPFMEHLPAFIGRPLHLPYIGIAGQWTAIEHPIPTVSDGNGTVYQLAPPVIYTEELQ